MTPTAQPVDRVRLRRELRRDSRVQRLLRHQNWKLAAEEAIEYLVEEKPARTALWRRTKTWEQVQAAFHDVKSRAEAEALARRSGATMTFQQNCRPGVPSASSEDANEIFWWIGSSLVVATLVFSPLIFRGSDFILLLIGFAGIALHKLLRTRMYRVRHGSWKEGLAALDRDLKQKAQTKRDAKWEAYRKYCREYTPEERYWHRYGKRQWFSMARRLIR